MVTPIFKNIQKRLSRNKSFEKIFNILEKTPAHAVHWYILMLVGLTITLANVGLAWFVFSGIPTKVSMGLEQTGNAATINRDELREALEVYRIRSSEFARLKQVPPKIIDPGR